MKPTNRAQCDCKACDCIMRDGTFGIDVASTVL